MSVITTYRRHAVSHAPYPILHNDVAMPLAMSVLRLPPLALHEQRVEGCWGTSIAVGSVAELRKKHGHDCGHKAALDRLDFVREYAAMWRVEQSVDAALWAGAAPQRS
jgi:hypothetical protein